MYCKNCGKNIKDGDEYCTNCKIDTNNKNTIEENKVHISTITKDKIKFFIILSILLIVIIFLVDLCIYKLKISMGETNNIVYIKNCNFRGIYNDLIVKQTDGKYGLIDTNGSEIIPCDYDNISNLKNGYATISKDKKCGLIDENGKIIIPCIYQNIDGEFVEGFMPVKKNDKWGFINENGEEIIPCKYDIVHNFSEGFALFYNNDEKYGFINTSGKEVIPYTLSIADDFNSGLAFVIKSGQAGFIDSNGVFSYKIISNGEKKYGIKNTNDKEILPCKYDILMTAFKNGFKVYDDNKTYFINKYGKMLNSYDGPVSFENGLFNAHRDDKYGFIDKSGKEVIPLIYEWTGTFSEGLVKVKKNSKYGFVNNFGKEIVPCIYDEVDDFFNGYQVNVKKDNKWGVVNNTGKEIVPCKFSSSIKSNGKIIYEIDGIITDMNQNTVLASTKSVYSPIIGVSFLLYLFLFTSLLVYFFMIKDGCTINIIELFKDKYAKMGNAKPIKSESLLETIDIKKEDQEKQYSSVADELFKYADLLEKGLITRAEFEDFKHKLK